MVHQRYVLVPDHCRGAVIRPAPLAGGPALVRTASARTAPPTEYLFEKFLDASDVRGAEAQDDSMHVFCSEDYDGVLQHTWVHGRDLRLIEVPTGVSRLYERSSVAWHEREPARERERRSC